MSAYRQYCSFAIYVLLVIVVWIGCQFVSGRAILPPTNLRLEYVPSPVIGIDVRKPRFSWTLQHLDRAQRQEAYQLWLSKSPTVSKGDVWDTGKVISNATSQHVYSGSVPLESDTSYFWKVRWWDSSDTVSDWSSVARFDTALFTSDDWSNAQWLYGYNQYRTEFNLDDHVTRARAYIAGIGYHELYINNVRIGDSVLDPGWTDYYKRILYVTHDVSNALKYGKNAIGVMLGNGWWGQPAGYRGNRTVLFKLSIETQFGNKTFVVSDTKTWLGKNGPIIFDSVYDGETYDARLEEPGWTLPGFNNDGWKTPNSGSGPGGVLTTQLMPPIRALETFKPIKMTQPKPGVYVFDFGQNFSGWCRLRVKASRGTTITLRHAEILQNNGMIYTANLRSAKATDTYICKGDPNGEVYEPRFTYHGFRFVELTGYPGVPNLDTLVAVHVSSAVPRNGLVSFNIPALNQLQSNILYGQRSNLMSVPTDCDQRDERLGWMADAHLSAEEAFHNFYMPSFYTNWLQLIADDQGNDGTVTDVVPYIRYGSRPADPAWGAAYPLLLWWMYEYYGDVSILAKHYSSLKLYHQYIIQRVSNSGLNKIWSYYGDWVPPPPAPKCSGQLVSAFFYLLNLKQMAAIAKLLGNGKDAQYYNDVYSKAVSQFNSAWYHNNTYDIGVQTAMALPLYLGIVPNPQAVVTTLLNDIANHQNHLTTGIIGTKYLLLFLSDIGRTDVALKLATQTSYPSWIWEWVQTLETPATTLWELWDAPNEGPGMNSRNHIMMGSVGHWFYRNLAGIQQERDTVGYSTLNITPPPTNVLLNSLLTSVKAIFGTPNGDVVVFWQRSGGDIFAKATPGAPIVLDCGINGVVQNVSFVFYGHDMEGFTPLCVDQEIQNALHTWCQGKTYCQFVTPSKFLISDACKATLPDTTVPTLFVHAHCTAMPSLLLNVTVPVGSIANIHVNKLQLSNVAITESGRPVWKDGKYISGVPGIQGAKQMSNEIIFQTYSGNFSFFVSGVNGQLKSAVANEDEEMIMSCPRDMKISFIRFASFGTPQLPSEWQTTRRKNEEYSGRFFLGRCHAGSSMHVVEQLCLDRQTCKVKVNSSKFGINHNLDGHCTKSSKQLAVQYYCAH
jgi:alpha-L-rhamnosidase